MRVPLTSHLSDGLPPRPIAGHRADELRQKNPVTLTNPAENAVDPSPPLKPYRAGHGLCRCLPGGSSSHSTLQIFNTLSTAYTTPTGIFHVDFANGNDTTGDGLTKATAWKSKYKAVQALNALGGGGGIMRVYNTGHYARSNNFYGASANAQPTVDICAIAHDGVIDPSTTDAVTWEADRPIRTATAPRRPRPTGSAYSICGPMIPRGGALSS
jgi:hypothetical protein